MVDWRGIALPIVNSPGGHFPSRHTNDLISSSILMITGTRPGTEVGEPLYGCYITEIIFEPNDFILEGLSETYIEEALNDWEPRIEVIDVQANADGHKLIINILYIVNATGERVRVALATGRGELFNLKEVA